MPQAEVKQAFDAARRGDFGPSSELVRQGPGLAHDLAPYLDDPDEGIRSQAVTLLREVGGPDALSLLVHAAGDPSREIQERAADALYKNFEPGAVAAHPDAAKIAESVRNGNRSAAALLLLGHMNHPQAAAGLRAARDQVSDHTKLEPWGPVVPAALAANIALSRQGDSSARAALRETIQRGDEGDLRFLLSALREIDDPALLHAIADATLTDRRPTGTGAPSGVVSPRRVSDDAVNAFVVLLHLPVSFPLRETDAYSEAEIEEVRRLVRNRMPQ